MGWENDYFRKLMEEQDIPDYYQPSRKRYEAMKRHHAAVDDLMNQRKALLQTGVFNPTNKLDEEMSKVLYEITTKRSDSGTELPDLLQYGHKLAINSKGEWVMELKGSGAVVTVDKSQVAEVMPYTVGLEFVKSSDAISAAKRYHYYAKAGDVAVGDLVFVTTSKDFAIVKGVDTKSRSATKWLEGVKVAGTMLVAGENLDDL